MGRDPSPVNLSIGAESRARSPLLVCLPRLDSETRQCNNACRVCLLDPETLGATPLDRVPAGRDVVLAGFEPLLNRRVFAWMKAVRASGGRVVALVTNGRLCIYEKVVARLAEADVALIIVTLFGATSEEHDAFTRVPGSFQQAVDGIWRLRAKGLRVAVSFPLLEEPILPWPDGTHPCLDLAYRLTNTSPVSLPGGPRGDLIRPVQVGSSAALALPEHPGCWRYDAMLLTQPGRHFGPPLLPMVHVPLGTRCNNRCLYCNVRGGEDSTLHDRDYIETLLGHAARTFLPRGHMALDFIGGEPTMHPKLAALVSRARNLGFSWITVCTNGRRLTDKYLDRLVGAGLNGVRFSMHDHHPGRAGMLAGCPQAGERYVETARLLLSRTDVVPYFYRIILASNLNGLVDHLHWLAAQNRTGEPVRVHLGLPSQRGRMFENPALFPPLHRVRDVVREAVAVASDLGVEVTLFHAPGCLLPERPDLSACLHVETVQVDACTGAIVRLQFEGDAQHGAACEPCVWNAVCPGLPRYYHVADPTLAAAWPVPFEAS